MRQISLEEQKQLELDILIALDALCKEHNLRYYLNSGTLLGAVRHKGFIPWDDDIDLAMPREDYERLYKLFPQASAGTHLKLISYRDQTSIYPFFKVVDTRTVVVEEMVNPLYQTGVWVDIFPIDGIDSTGEIFNVNAKVKQRHNLLAANPNKATTPLRKLAKKVLVPLAKGNKTVYELAEELDRAAAANPIVKGEDVALVIWGYGPCERMPYSILETTTLEFEGREFSAPREWDTYLSSVYGDYMTLPPEKDQIPHYCKAYWKDAEADD